MDLEIYCEHILPANLKRVLGFNKEEIIKFCEHDAIHYLTEQGFTENEEILVAHLEVKHNIGFTGRNRFYNINPKKAVNFNLQLLTYDFLTQALIKDTALKMFKIVLDKYCHPLYSQDLLDFYSELSEPSF